MGRLIGTTTSYSFLTSRNFTYAYTYDAASNRTGFTDPEGGSTAYTYDTSLLAGYKYSPHPEPAHLARATVGLRQRIVRIQQ
jgi:YD repeat-containing protein